MGFILNGSDYVIGSEINSEIVDAAGNYVNQEISGCMTVILGTQASCSFTVGLTQTEPPVCTAY